MQTLYFEAAWERTLTASDRKQIIQVFNDVKSSLDRGIYFTFLWSAKNHRDDSLITTLIHNIEPRPLALTDTIIAYKEDDKLKYVNTFHVPEIIPAYHTMPWTFIFAKEKSECKVPDYIIYEK